MEFSMDKDLELLNDLRVGIVGCGHLGQAIARTLVSHGLERGNLLISYRGNPVTYQKLEEQGLASCLVENQRVFQEAGIVLITIKPQDILTLEKAAVPGEAVVVSCMAGIPAELLKKILGRDVYRMMLSGPDTIVAGSGVGAIYPEHGHLKLLLRSMNLNCIETMSEGDMDVFTAGVCLPAAILKAGDPIDQKKAIDKIGMEYPLLSELYTWAVKALPHFQNNAEEEAYVGRMVTKGGITEAIITGLTNGASLDTALQRGIDRTREISGEIQQSIMQSAKQPRRK